jgi:hypothetical protein
MKTILALLNRNKISTQRVDDLASQSARSALDLRMQRMLAYHASQPQPQPQHFPALQQAAPQPQSA